VEDPPPRSFNPSILHEAMVRRLRDRSQGGALIAIPAVPSLIDEYVSLCSNICASLGVPYTLAQSLQLKTVMQAELAQAFQASQRSEVVISLRLADGSGLNYQVKAVWRTIEADYDHWVDTRPAPLFGSEPDARVLALACEAADPTTHRVLDIGAGTGRNALALARRGHPVDAVEIAPKFADIIRTEAESESLGVRVIESDVFTAREDVHDEYQLIVLSEVVTDFRTTQELRGMFQLAADCLTPGGRLVFNTFLAHPGYTPDNAARELGQQTHTMIFTRDEVTTAAAGLPLERVADDSAYEYEKTHLPEGAWPLTDWFEGWAAGLNVFDVQREKSPIELRWLVYQKSLRRSFAEGVESNAC
jgi:SAM-dependent methyltransferase